ncbi:hypothetical protein FJTKL_06052 [Diaporthe vaccinii]|uniref:Cytochrome P450 n=1 Tax=Diaporthe vaccinii TaxID=105482 RepID=A0ABR4EX51_9PEZI
MRRAFPGPQSPDQGLTKTSNAAIFCPQVYLSGLLSFFVYAISISVTGNRSSLLTMNTTFCASSPNDGRTVLASPLHHYAVGILLLVASLVLAWKHVAGPKQRLLPGIPVIGGENKEDCIRNRERFRHDSKAMLTEGYFRNNINGGLFYVPSPLGERLMLPVRYLKDLKTAPIDKVDFVGTFIEIFEGKYTTFGTRSTLHPRTLKRELNKYLPDVMMDVQDEIVDSFHDIFPACSETEWTEVPLVDVITRIVARVSSRMFGGPELSRNASWVNASIAFAIDGFIGAQKLKKLPEIFKPVAARLIPEVRNLRKYYREAENAALPILAERSRTGERPKDLLSWMFDAAVGEETDPKFIAGILLQISFAAIHTTAAGNSQLIFDICANPDLIEMLREEHRNILNEEGKVGRQGFLQMRVMDSLMKESQRFNPLLLITFERIITEDWRLSDGMVIPAHTTIGVPAQAISMDPQLYTEPEKFDGLRFAKLRGSTTDPAKTGKAQFVAANPQSMAWGYGRHACPGRFFASDEIKAITIYLLNNYDIKFAAGQKRPESLQVEMQYLPDHAATILFQLYRSVPRVRTASASKMVKLDFNLERDVPELNGKMLLITGAKMLASRHPAKIYITGRNQAAAQQTIDSIKSSTGSATQLEWIRCDHANLATVKEAADKILAKESRLDVLKANAGIMALPPGPRTYDHRGGASFLNTRPCSPSRGLLWATRGSRTTVFEYYHMSLGADSRPTTKTSDDYELHFGINHLAHALLIRKLLPLLQKTANTHGEARIIPISSLALVLAPTGGIVFDDLKTTQAYWVLGKWQRYAQSKLANLLYGKELSRRYPEILKLIADPGPSDTGLVTSLG